MAELKLREPLRELNYIPLPEDGVALAELHYILPGAVKKRNVLAAFHGVWIGIASLALLFGTASTGEKVFFLALLGIFYVIAVPVHNRGSRKTLRRELGAAFQQMRDGLGDRSIKYVVSPDGMAVIAPDQTTLYPWSSVNDVFATDDHIFLVANEGYWLVLPKRLFRDDADFNEVADRLIAYVVDHRKPEPASQPG